MPEPLDQPAPGRTDQELQPGRLGGSAGINPHWAPPTISPIAPLSAARRRRSRWISVGVPVLVVAVVIGLVTGLGGFGRRTDLITTIPPGQLFSTGPFEFTFTEATAQRKKDFNDQVYWEVIVSGTARNTGTTSLAPQVHDATTMFIAKDLPTAEIQEPYGDRIGDGTVMTRASSLTPGLPAVPYAVIFRFSDHYRPGPTLLFGATELEYSDNSLIQSDHKTWNNTDYLYRLDVPVTALPDDLG